MTTDALRYELADGQFGTKVIRVTGRCSGDSSQVAEILGNRCLRFELEPFPQAQGVVLKALDGSNPSVVEVTPSTIGRTFNCVKVGANVAPLAPAHSGGPYANSNVLTFEIIYQQVGDL
jgi:hypothetical protein